MHQEDFVFRGCIVSKTDWNYKQNVGVAKLGNLANRRKGKLLKQLHERFDICCGGLAGVVFADVRCCGVVNLGFASEKW